MKIIKRSILIFLLLAMVVGVLVSCSIVDFGIQGEQGIQGEPGEDGKDGTDGKDGADGITPLFRLDGEELYVSYDEGKTWENLGKVSGADGKDGVDGEDGVNGKDGINGEDGVGIEKVEFNENGDLVITLTNGNIQVVVMPKHTHSFDDWIAYSTNVNDCESCLFYRICNQCSDIEWKQGSYEDHNWNIVATPPTYDAMGYDTKTCTICGKTEIDNYVDAFERIKITDEDFTWLQGGVNSDTGEVNNTFTNNWYADIKIPKGAEAVRFLTFKTYGRWGSAFLSDNEYISGICDQDVGFRWITVDIPEGATIFRYGYLQDWKTESDKVEMFQYIEFIGTDMEETTQITEKMERPANGTHAFTVKVDISSILGKNTPIKATDYGYIMFPENYSKNGEATRLIIVCHGASATLSTYQSFDAKSHSQTYWLEMGYAIMDMYACPPALGNGSELHYGNSTVLECYEKGYEYVMKRFNLKSDGIFVLGSSMGGLSSFQIVQSERFPVIAQVANCPVIDLFKQAYCNPWTSTTYQRSKIAHYFGFEGVQPTFTVTKHIPSNEEVDYFVSNFSKIVSYSPIFTNITSGNIFSTVNEIPNNAISANSAEAALYAQLTATHPCPLLIIHNKDDATVSYRYSEYFTQMLQRGGADVSLKLYESGGHNAWANGANGEIKNYKGETILLSESQRLAIEFFKKYE